MKKLFYKVCVILIVLVPSNIVSQISQESEVPSWSKWYKTPVVENAKRTFYVDAVNGNDNKNGKSDYEAWKTIDRVNAMSIRAGDHILFRKGQRFLGSLKLIGVQGTAHKKIAVSSYGAKKNDKAIIDGKGFRSAIEIRNSSHVYLEDLEISNNHDVKTRILMELPKKKWQKKKKIKAYGVFVSALKGGASKDIYMNNLYIHDVYPAVSRPSEGKTKKTYYGYGVAIKGGNNIKCMLKNIAISGCRIERTGHFGIRTKSSPEALVENLFIHGNTTKHTGGSGLIVWASNVLVTNNVFNHSGSYINPRMHGRGSGSWTFAATNVLYENNKFMNSTGLGDSAGVHIDFNCRNVIVQRNFSYNNEGGFMEVLGNNYNCAYRYNISVNDGSRIKGINGAAQEGKVLFVSGHCMKAPYGPFNSYFYNNTIYVKEGLNPKFAITHSAKGLMIVNNIFHLESDAIKVLGDQPTAKRFRKRADRKVDNAIFKNNMYTRATTLPSDLIVDDTNKIIANPKYKEPGSKSPTDYIPLNRSAVKDKGIYIEALLGDELGLEGGLNFSKDFFGNPIVGKPDMGAIEIK
jgi:hypothetical protein